MNDPIEEMCAVLYGPKEWVAITQTYGTERGTVPFVRRRVRAAVRKLAECFADPVVKNALLWAAAEGEPDLPATSDTPGHKEDTNNDA